MEADLVHIIQTVIQFTAKMTTKMFQLKNVSSLAYWASMLHLIVGLKNYLLFPTTISANKNGLTSLKQPRTDSNASVNENRLKFICKACTSKGTPPCSISDWLSWGSNAIFFFFFLHSDPDWIKRERTRKCTVLLDHKFLSKI